jgi:hypothetical protein
MRESLQIARIRADAISMEDAEAEIFVRCRR